MRIIKCCLITQFFIVIFLYSNSAFSKNLTIPSSIHFELSNSEYNLIVEKLDREPNDLELGLFGALWSEHCGYKHTKKLLRTIKSKSDFTLTEAGEENAGAINIGSNKAIVMKIESHNHPSAIEPYEVAATGIGGIVRDIFAMGARPIAL